MGKCEMMQESVVWYSKVRYGGVEVVVFVFLFFFSRTVLISFLGLKFPPGVWKTSPKNKVPGQQVENIIVITFGIFTLLEF